MDPHAAHIDYRRSQFFAEADTRRLASTVSQSPRGTGHPTRRHARRALIAAMTAVLLAAGVRDRGGRARPRVVHRHGLRRRRHLPSMIGCADALAPARASCVL